MNHALLYVMPSIRWNWCALMPFFRGAQQVERSIHFERGLLGRLITTSTPTRPSTAPDGTCRFGWPEDREGVYWECLLS